MANQHYYWELSATSEGENPLKMPEVMAESGMIDST
jgi:hypothetical protein